MDFVKIVNSKLHIEEISNLVSSPSCGAISMFAGTTRNNFENKEVVQLEYEAYEPMAEKAIKKVCKDIREKWQVENIAIYHRLGVVPVQEASVVIAVSSPHRTESLQAVHYAIDALKSSTPIWKKEVYASQQAEWKENEESNKSKIIKRKADSLEDSLEQTLHDTKVPSHLIQIKAGFEEISRRISSFIERKREQANLGNIQDFCYHGSKSLSDNSCARVDALLIKRKDSKSHLRVRRVMNLWGPQTRGIDPGSAGSINPPDPGTAFLKSNNIEDCQKSNSTDMASNVQEEAVLPEGVEERLNNAECHLKLKGPVPKDVYARLRRIEDQILHLESISPEYFNFRDKDSFQVDSANSHVAKKQVYTIADLESKLCHLEYKLSNKEKK